MDLVIAEKPSVASSIAKVLKANKRKDGYFEGNFYIVSWCYGHLVSLADPEKYDTKFKLWNYQDLPLIPDKWKYIVKEDTKKQFELLKQLMNDSRINNVVCATDAGREGELIFRLVVNKAGCKKKMKRLWTSSLEDDAIKQGFSTLKPIEDYNNLYQSALCRLYADWLVGINGTRLFTLGYRTPEFKLLKVGRVQSPTLAMIVEREKQIKGFVKKPFYTVVLKYGDIIAKSARIENKDDAEKIVNLCDGKQATVTKIEKEKKVISPPKLYDLTTLQREANTYLGYKASDTLAIAQSLYEKKLISYPRTDSKYLNDDMKDSALQVLDVVKQVMKIDSSFHNIDIVLDSSKVSDHHALIPTLEIQKYSLSDLKENEKNILLMIGYRFVCATSKNHEYEAFKAIIDCEGYLFTLTGKSVLNDGWKAFEQRMKAILKCKNDKEEIKPLPSLQEMQTLYPVKISSEESFTSPPKRYTEATLLRAMETAGVKEMSDEVERKGLGTPATRAEIIEKLVHDGYITREKKNLTPTENGIKLIDILPERVKSVDLTVEWENQLTLISKGEYNKDDFLNTIVEMIQELVKSYKTNNSLNNPSVQSLGKCPNCGGDVFYGKFGGYCKNKCGMNLSKYYSTSFTKEQVQSLLEGKSIIITGLTNKKGKPYDIELIPNGIEEYSYKVKNKTVNGFQYKYDRFLK